MPESSTDEGVELPWEVLDALDVSHISIFPLNRIADTYNLQRRALLFL